MAQRCGTCGSASTSTGTSAFTCFDCGASTVYAEPADRGRVPNPDGPATYHGDHGTVYEGPTFPVVEADAKPKKKR